MKRKFYINSNIERLIFFTTSLFVILILNIILTNTLLKKIEKSAKLNVIQHCDNIIDDYANALRAKLETIQSSVDLVYAKIAYKTISDEKIRQLLISEKDNILPPFNNFVYANKDGVSWNSFGEEIPLNDREYFQQVISGKTQFYVSDILESKSDGNSIIMFARPVYNEDNEITGVIAAICPTQESEKFFSEIKIGSGEKISIRDSKGKFIKHYDSRWTNWFFHSGTKIPVTFDSVDLDSSIMQTTNTVGQPVYLFYQVLDIAPWIVGLTINADEFTNIERQQHAYHYFIIELIVIVLSMVFLFEIWMHSFLERHQILSTHIDSITHLWVRSYFEKEANKFLKRNSNSKFLMIECDIRGFKFINQNYGEAQANKLLLHFSKILYDCAKIYDGLLCRGYADHFFVFMKITTVHKAMHLFKTELSRISNLAKQTEIPFIPKFGLAFYLPNMREDIQSVQILITRASFAKSTIKENALQQFSIYDEKLLKKSKNENFIETHMESSLNKDEFFVMYQPKIDLATEKVVGAEALVRWESPELGFMPPDSFVPLFERNNFIVKLDFYVYEQVFKFIRKCLDNNLPTVPISVNVSRNHDKPEKFVHDFMSLLKKYAIPPRLIEVELLERATLDKNLLREITIMLQKEGFRVAMDDFGSGESSLNMLSTIPVNILKFDRSFLFANDSANGTLDETSESFIATLVDLGKNLKKETIFEGVETEEQRDFLRKIKCDQVQGYFYSKPLREADYMAFLEKHI